MCAKVPKLEFVHDDEGYTSEWKVNKFDCEGGCGLNKDYCCQAIETKTVPVIMVNQNTTPKKKHTEVSIVNVGICVTNRSYQYEILTRFELSTSRSECWHLSHYATETVCVRCTFNHTVRNRGSEILQCDGYRVLNTLFDKCYRIFVCDIHYY